MRPTNELTELRAKISSLEDDAALLHQSLVEATVPEGLRDCLDLRKTREFVEALIAQIPPESFRTPHFGETNERVPCPLCRQRPTYWGQPDHGFTTLGLQRHLEQDKCPVMQSAHWLRLKQGYVFKSPEERAREQRDAEHAAAHKKAMERSALLWSADKGRPQ